VTGHPDRHQAGTLGRQGKITAFRRAGPVSAKPADQLMQRSGDPAGFGQQRQVVAQLLHHRPASGLIDRRLTVEATVNL
jgi:hypothetical protein